MPLCLKSVLAQRDRHRNHVSGQRGLEARQAVRNQKLGGEPPLVRSPVFRGQLRAWARGPRSCAQKPKEESENHPRTVSLSALRGNLPKTASNCPEDQP